MNEANKLSNVLHIFMPSNRFCINTENRIKIISFWFRMPDLFFQLFPASLFCFFCLSLCPLSLFLLGLELFVPKVNKLISLLLPRLLRALVVFSRSLFHSCSLCVFSFFPHPLSSSLRFVPSFSSPLGFSPVERLSDEGNDSVTAFDSAECFCYGSVKQTYNLCVRKSQRSQ